MNISNIRFAAKIAGIIGLSFFLAHGCNDGGGKNDGNPLSPGSVSISIDVAPSTLSIARLGTQTFTATGGTGTYSWSVNKTGLGSIDPSTGAFIASNTIASLYVIATDTANNTGRVAVNIVAIPVDVSPLIAILSIGGTQTFTATGGTGSSYIWTVGQTSLGTIDQSGVFTAGTIQGSTPINATDTAGNSGSANATILSDIITISPLNSSIVVGGTQTFTATGGTGTYSWSIDDTSLGSIVLSTGVFTAGTTVGNVTVTATDTAGKSDSTTIYLTSTTSIVVSPLYTNIIRGGTQTFTATGGTGTYTWSINDTTLGTIVASTGAFTAGTTATTSLIVTATDTAGNTGSSTSITINAVTLAITPTSLNIDIGGTQTFTATGGTGTYTWSIDDTTLASIASTTGAFTAGTTATTTALTVTATDTGGNTGSASVTINATPIVITPLALTINVGGTQTFTATGGTGTYYWTSSDLTVGTIVALTGVFSAVATGTTTITATDTAGNTATATVTVL